MTRPASRRHARAAGFTLIELIVVVGILTIVTGHILSILAGQLLTYEGQRAVTEVQDDARLAADLVFHDLRMAGFMVPQAAGVSAVDGGNAGPDRLCVSDPSVLDENRIDLASGRFDGASIGSDVGANDGSVSIAAAERDIDGDGTADFVLGAGIILVDGTHTHCARITNVGASDISFTPSTPTAPPGFSVTAANGVAVPANVYEGTAGGLMRNNLLVSAQVEDFQVEFAVDLNNDGQIVEPGEFPLHGMNTRDPRLLRQVRLSVLTRTVLEDPQLPDGSGRPGVANRAADGTPDGFRRRLVTVSAAPRNVL